MNVTSVDIARVAKVSQATVSRVLNGNPNVSEEKRAAVLAAMEAVGYRPNALAQGLRMRKTSTIGVVVAGITNPFYPEALEAVGKQLERAGQRMVLWDSDRGGEDAALDAVRQGLVDGVIFTSVSEGSGTLEEALRLGAPVVLLNRGSAEASCDQVTSNNFEGAVEAARYLHQIGHRRIWSLVRRATAWTASFTVCGSWINRCPANWCATRCLPMRADAWASANCSTCRSRRPPFSASTISPPSGL
jgi:LacI family transcriptional regulator